MPRFFPSLLAFCLAFANGPLDAQQSGDSKVSANVLTDRVAVGEFGTLIIKVTGGETAAPEGVATEGLEIVKSGSQSSITIADGKQSLVTSHFYRFRGNEPGAYEIPPVELSVRGESVTTKSIPVEIFERSPEDEARSPTREFFAKLEVSRDEFYVNEIVPFNITAYVRGRNAISQVLSPTLDHESFVSKGFRDVRTDGGDMGNTYYSSAVIDSHLFALKPGRHRLGPGELGVRILDSRGGFGLSIFPRTVTRELSTDVVDVTVKPLPNGAPASFTGGVGYFELSAKASATEVNLGDPVSMEIEVKGVGNLRTLGPPAFSVPQKGIWKTYEASKTLEDEDESDGFKPGRAVFSQVIIPEAKVGEIPAYELAFFDPDTEQYVTRHTEPIPISISVNADRNRSAPAAISFPPNAEAGESFERAETPTASYSDMLHIRTGRPRWVAEAELSSTGLPFLVAQILFSLGLFTILGIGAARGIARVRSARSDAAPILTFAQSLKRLPKAGTTRREFYRAASTSLMLWKSEHPEAPGEVHDVVARVSERCEAYLYGGSEDGTEPVSKPEVEEFRSILHRLPRR
ncbi:MAG: BatD family protein [Verrucomicrobiales bacterium]